MLHIPYRTLLYLKDRLVSLALCHYPSHLTWGRRAPQAVMGEFQACRHQLLPDKQQETVVPLEGCLERGLWMNAAKASAVVMRAGGHFSGESQPSASSQPLIILRKMGQRSNGFCVRLRMNQATMVLAKYHASPTKHSHPTSMQAKRARRNQSKCQARRIRPVCVRPL